MVFHVHELKMIELRIDIPAFLDESNGLPQLVVRSGVCIP